METNNTNTIEERILDCIKQFYLIQMRMITDLDRRRDELMQVVYDLPEWGRAEELQKGISELTLATSSLVDDMKRIASTVYLIREDKNDKKINDFLSIKIYTNYDYDQALAFKYALDNATHCVILDKKSFDNTLAIMAKKDRLPEFVTERKDPKVFMSKLS